MLIGYGSDRNDRAIEDVALEFTGALGTVGARTRASAACGVTLAKAGYATRRERCCFGYGKLFRLRRDAAVSAVTANVLRRFQGS